MNKEVKKKWVAALRSGEYKQGHYRLKNDDKYCCLGVLSDLYNKENPEKQHTICGWFLDSTVQKWAGLNSNNPKVIHNYGKQTDTLSLLNDELDKTFEEIADIIEWQL